jgi:glycosyltransferase involved in cell wall biosynthesis
VDYFHRCSTDTPVICRAIENKALIGDPCSGDVLVTALQMKILWVKAGKLLPVDTGGKIRSYNLLRHLAGQHKVSLLSYYGGRRDLEYEAEIVRQLPGARTIYTAAPESKLAQTLDYIFRLPAHAPYAVTKFTHPEVRRTVTQWLAADRPAKDRFDVAVCDFLSASLNFPDVLHVPTVLFQHNVETVLWRRMAQTESTPWRKLSYRIEAGKMARYEKAALAKFHHVIAVSDGDRDEMKALDPRCPLTVVSTGVDTNQYRVGPSAPGNPPIVVFTGSMDWEPNIDAVEYFCSEIWPAVLAAFPEARFQIVGRNPHGRVRRLASANVEVTGTVPSVADFLSAATVVIVPLRIGGGTRLKIFEAMAMGKAVVSTSIGAEGLDVTPGRDLLLADDPAGFTAGILRLFREPALRRQYEQAAASLALRYDWAQIAQRFADVLRAAVADFQNRTRAEGRPVLPVGP